MGNRLARTVARSRDWLIMPGTRPRDFILPILIVCLTLTVSMSAYKVFRTQELDSALIDIAGNQRMLLQRHFREIQFGEPAEERAWGTLQRLSETASILRHGGDLLVDETTLQTLHLEPATDPLIQSKLEEQIRILGKLEQLSGKPWGAEGYQLLESAILNANETTRLFVDASQARIRMLLLAAIGLTLILAVLGLWLNRLIVERGLRMKQLLAAKEAAVRASEAKSQFLANMSHEIRTPLNAIIGMSDILHETELTRDQLRFVDTLRRAGETLLALINDILDLSKIESGQLVLQPEEADLTDLVDRIGEIMALRAHQKGLELTCYVAPEVPRHVLVDGLHVRQVLMNLLGNAVKFTSSGEISLRLELAEPARGENALLRFSVTDTGIGIPESRFQAIFESFSQADPSIAVNYGGTGLGLAISRRLVEFMGGRIDVKSRLGTGSTFTFTVPVRTLERAEVPPAQSATMRGKRVLVVDDNETNRLIVRHYLGGGEIALEEAPGGPAALALLREAKAAQRPYDLILLDYRMPEANGIEIAERIQREKLGNEAIVMLLTSDGRRQDLTRMSELGISEYLIKPIRKAELLQAIESALSPQRDRTPREPLAGTVAATVPCPSLRGRRILVVDDVEDNRFVISSYLGPAGATIDEARGGEEAIQCASRNDYDAILMDVRMSPIDGYAATEAIRLDEASRNRRRVPIIAVTAHALKEDIERAGRAGCDSHLVKPINRAKLYLALAPIASRSEEAAAPIRVEVEDFLKPRLAAYLQNRIAEIQVLTEALGARDFERIAVIGHNVAGTAGIYGMDELSRLASQMEQVARRSDPTGITATLERIQSYLERVTPA
ncbi:MAG: response regulator [Oligoflexia bacterium]|nr:response regulator [Oligoflexia bacterium]